MSGKKSTPDVNFHIGAPGVAADIIKDLIKSKIVRKDAHTRVLRAEEYRRFFRPQINGSSTAIDMVAAEMTERDRFWQKLSQFEVLAASQHAMLGPVKQVLRQGIILPFAADRIERLADIFKNQKLDLHITIVRQSTYISSIPAEQLKIEDLEPMAGGLVSWFEFVARIRHVCPDNQFYIWDFSEPAKVALPFAMSLLNFEKALTPQLTPIVRESIEHRAVLSKIFDAHVLDQNLCSILDAQFENDLENIEALPRTSVITPSTIPSEFFIKTDPPA